MGHGDVFAFKNFGRWTVPAVVTGTPAVMANEVFYCAAEIWRQVDAHPYGQSIARWVTAY